MPIPLRTDFDAVTVRAAARKSKDGGHLRDNIGAIDVNLSSADLRDIDAAFSAIKVEGGRMNSDQMKVVDTEA